MFVDVKLAASLRNDVSSHDHGLVRLEIEGEATVKDVVERLGLSPERIKMVMVNGRGDTLDTRVRDRDRISLFPPELAFNMYVAISFRRDGAG